MNRPIIVTAATESLLAADRGARVVGGTSGASVGGAVVGALVGLVLIVGDGVGTSVGGMQQLSDPTLTTVSQIVVPVRYTASAAASPHVLIKLLKSGGTASFSSMSNPSQNGQEFDGWTSEQQKAE